LATLRRLEQAGSVLSVARTELIGDIAKRMLRQTQPTQRQGKLAHPAWPAISVATSERLDRWLEPPCAVWSLRPLEG